MQVVGEFLEPQILDVDPSSKMCERFSRLLRGQRDVRKSWCK
jgi:hypothetical protein